MADVLRRSPYLSLVVLAAAIIGGCLAGCQPPTTSLPMDLLATQVETMAAAGVASMNTISASGRLSGYSEQGTGSGGFVLLYDPRVGMRLEVVDPIYRPLLIAILRNDVLYVHDPSTGRTESGDDGELLARWTGIVLPAPVLASALLGQIPPGRDLTASPEPDCDETGAVICFAMREKSGRLSSRVELSAEDGRIQALQIPAPFSERTAVRVEIEGYRPGRMARRIKILRPATGEYLQLRCDEQVVGEPIDPAQLDPLKLTVERLAPRRAKEEATR